MLSLIRGIRGASLCATALICAGLLLGWSGPAPLAASVRALESLVRVLACSTSMSEITPCTSSQSIGTNASGSKSFTVKNKNGFESVSYVFSCTVVAPVASCTPPAGVTIAANSSRSVTATYTTGAAIGAGSMTLIADDGMTPVDARLDVTVSGGPPSSAVAVTPDAGTAAPAAGKPSSQAFTVENVGNQTATYVFTVACTGRAVVDCSTPASVTLAAGVSATATVTFTAGDDAMTGEIRLTASADGFQDTGSVNATATSYNVLVSPDSVGASANANASGNSQAFVVQNVGTATATYSLAPVCAGTVSACSASPSSVTLAAGASASVNVSYTAGAHGTTGTAGLRATFAGNSAVTDDGFANVRALAPCETSEARITPCTRSVTDPASTTGLFQVYSIENKNRFEPVSFWVECRREDGVSQCSFHPDSIITLSSVTVPALGARSDTVYYKTLSAASTGLLTVEAQGTDFVGMRVNVSISRPTRTPLRLASLTPSYQKTELEPQQSVSRTFVLTNHGDSAASYTIARSCTGAAIAAPCTPATETVSVNAGASLPLPITFTSSSTIGSPGTVKVVATHTLDAGVRDSGVVEVEVQRNPPGLVASSVNPGTTIDRDLCLTAAAAASTAYECGALRLEHALPSVRTLQRERMPTLLYNSSVAHPHVVVAGILTLAESGSLPQSVSAELRVNGIPRASASWSGTDWTLGGTRRLALGFDAIDLATGVHPYWLKVTRQYTGGPQSDSVPGELIVVNRSQSPFGAGWWLAGLEQLVILDATTILWVGGDGSARKYTNVAPNVWTAPALDRPDTLKWVVGESRYVRLLPHGLKVKFNADGKHVSTVNRLAHETVFGYTAQCLTSIAVPTPGPVVQYSFGYTNNCAGTSDRLTSATAPPLGAVARVTSLTPNASGQVIEIRDPDATTVGFGYDAAVTHRMTSRTDRRGTITRFAYGPASLLASATIELDGGQTIVTSFTPQETRGLNGATAPPVAAAYTKLDGPRTDVGDSTLFWLDRFGAPVKIRDALGNETRIARGDARWPALATWLRSPDGRVVGAAYDDRGNVVSVTDSSAFDPSRSKYATTLYEWDAAWDFVKKVTLPEGEVTNFDYDPLNGNRLGQQPGADSARKVRFAYNHPQKLPTSTLVPGSARDSLHYDALGNLSFVQTPRGVRFRTYFYKDAIGRDTLVSAPIDTNNTLWSRQRVWYDLAGQDTLSAAASAAAPDAQPPSGALTRYVRKRYDNEGNLLSHAQWSVPDTNHVDTLTRTWQYDRAHRKTLEIAPGPWADDESYAYDPAGNVTVHTTRRNKPIAASYDALNRVIQRVVPRIGLSVRDYTWGGYIPADTARFGYDAAGRMRWAINRYARVTRSYHTAGTLASDTLRIRVADTSVANFDQHVYGIRYGYDLNGRRKWMKHPATIAPAVNADSGAYAYESVFGALAWVEDVHRNRFSFAYDSAGRLRMTTMPGGISETRTYLPDGALDTRVETGPQGLIHDDRSTYDARGKLVNVRALIPETGGVYDNFPASYDSFGALTSVDSYSEMKRTESFQLDALGNQYQKVRTGGGQGARTTTHVYEATSGQLLEMLATPSVVTTAKDTTRHEYDGAGNAMRAYAVRAVRVDGALPVFARTQTRYWYSGDDRLAATTIRRDSVKVGDPWPAPYEEREEYWYDALGRRVWVLVHRGGMCAQMARETGCRSSVTRTVWDGDQLLYEIRYPETYRERDTGSAAASNMAHFGRVAYTHAGVIDRPVGILRMDYGVPVVVPHQTYRGLFDSGTCTGGTLDCGDVEWPAKTVTAYYEMTAARDTGALNWYGSLLDEKRDGSGLLYVRNRYLDPQSGRFTQEDPIGLAGGLNLYGFANGDPVNFSDPFGLCPVCVVYGVFEVGASLYDAYDLAKTAVGYARGKVSKTELGITAAGAGAGIFGFGGGYGKLGREAASRLIRDVSDNPSNWKVVGTFTEAATNKKAKGGVSIQTIVENEAGDRLVRHTVVDKSGKVIDDHYRPMFKPRDVDRQ